MVVLVDKRPRKDLEMDTFRLDRYESFATFQINLANLSRLMEDSERRLVPCVVACKDTV